tara:strand:+ start:8797 stop:11373 length:2577 start_codon:yes stop_codon:yes gene_type:complete
MAAETLENLITAINNADGMLATASPEDSIIIQADIAEMVARIKEKYPDYKPANIADISRENLESQLQTMTAEAPIVDQGIETLNQIVTNDTAQVVDQEALAEQEIITEDPQPTGHKILAELGEGRFVYELANGTRGYIDQKAGLSTTNPDMVEAALAHFEQGEAYTGDTVEDISKKQWFEDIIMDDETQARLDKFMSEWLFIGKGFDEAAEWIGNNLGKDGEQIAADMKLRIKAMEEARPGEAMALGIGGAITSVIPAMIGLPATFYTWMATLPWAMATGVSAGASGVFNLTEGFVSGWLDSEEGRRTEEGIDRGIRQGAIGIVTGPLSVFAPKVIAIGYNRIKNGVMIHSVPKIMEMFDISKGAAKLLKDAVSAGGDSLNEVLKRMNKGGSQTMIADAGIAIQSLTDAIAAASGQAAEIVQGAILKRVETVAGTVDKTLDKVIAKLPFMKDTLPKEGLRQDARQVARDLAKQTAPERTKWYKKAYEHKVNYHSDEGKAVMDVLNRMPPDLMKRALKGANDLLKMEGQDAFQITAEIGEDGIIKWVKQPNFMQLDYIKRALSEVAYGDAAVPIAGQGIAFQPSAMSKQAKNMRYMLNEALKKMNPAYGKAVKLGQDKITRENAIDIGENAMNNNVTVAQLVRLLADKNIGEAERKMVMLGFRANLDRLLGNVKATATHGADTQAMKKLWKDMTSKNAQKKLKLLIPNKKEYNQIVKMLDKAEAALNLQAAVNINSKTAIRLQQSESLKELGQEGIIRQVAEGQKSVLDAPAMIVGKLMSSKLMTARVKNTILKELAQVMTELKGAPAREAYKKLYKAVRDDNVGQDTLLELTRFMMGRLRLTPTIAATQTYKQVTEDN